VLIADDDDLMRAGLAELLTSDATIEVVAEASSGRQAVDRAAPATRRGADGRPHAGSRWDRGDRRAVEGGPTTRVLILTTFEEDD
jgi:CheY-like chemotaxis protein